MKPCSASLLSQPSPRQAPGKRCRRSRCVLTARTRSCSASEPGLFLGKLQPKSRAAQLICRISSSCSLQQRCSPELVWCTTREPQYEHCLGKSPSAGLSPGQPMQSHPEVTENLTWFVKRQLQCFWRCSLHYKITYKAGLQDLRSGKSAEGALLEKSGLRFASPSKRTFSCACWLSSHRILLLLIHLFISPQSCNSSGENKLFKASVPPWKIFCESLEMFK